MTAFLRTYIKVRKFLSYVMNRNFLVFLFFLLLSASFWLFLSLDDEYERDFTVPVHLRHVPEDVVITTDLPSSIHVVLKDKGSELLRYRYSGLPAINVDFRNYDQHSGHVSLAVSDFTKTMSQKLLATTKIVSAKPDRMEYYFNYGLNVKMPVRLRSSIKTEALYGVSSVRVVPDSVTVFAISEVLDTMSNVYTEPLYVSGLTSGETRVVPLTSVRGAKFEPDKVKVRIDVDQMTEKTVLVPIRWVNFPATKVLRTFPSKVKIIFQVGMSMYRKISADDFVLVLRYDDLLKETDGKVSLSLKSLPSGVSHVRIVPSKVEFLIEDATEEN